MNNENMNKTIDLKHFTILDNIIDKNFDNFLWSELFNIQFIDIYLISSGLFHFENL